MHVGEENMKKMTLALCVSAVAITMSVSGAYAKSDKAGERRANVNDAAAAGQAAAAANCGALVNRNDGSPWGSDNTDASGGNSSDPKTKNTHVANCDQYYLTMGDIGSI